MTTELQTALQNLANPDNWGMVYAESEDKHVMSYQGPEGLPWRHIEPLPELISDLIRGCKAALNMVDGDGQPPSWSLLREAVAKAERL